jgi:ABC-type proline/glycine betaine transport system substrate-binding protein
MLYDVIETAEAQIAQWLEQHAQLVSADVLGLDTRCGQLWVCDEAIVCNTDSRQRLDYYGGFEYVHKEQVKAMGRYTIYEAGYEDSDRVRECIERWEEQQAAV